MNVTIEVRYRVMVAGQTLDLSEGDAAALLDALVARLPGMRPTAAAHATAPDPDPPPPMPDAPDAGATYAGATYAEPESEFVTGAWLDDEIELVRGWLREDVPMKEMATRLNRKYQNVYNRAGMIRLEMAKAVTEKEAGGWDSWKVNQLREIMRAPGGTTAKAAERIDKPLAEVNAVWTRLLSEKVIHEVRS